MCLKYWFVNLNLPKPDIIQPNSVNSLLNLNDRLIRYSLIPLLGIGISHIFQIFYPYPANSIFYWTGNIYYILLSFSIWQGNRFFLFKQRKHYSWFNQPARKVALLLFANVFYTAPVTIIFLWGWFQLPVYNEVPWDKIQLVVLVNVIAVVFISHVYETVFLIRERENDILKMSQLQQAQIQAQLNALKAQIDPHFMFNSLNTLHYLINQDQAKARMFTQNLSDVYRYILMHKDDKLVMLAEELDFAKHYLHLMEVRFGKSLQLNIDLPPQQYLIPPVSLQLLFENIYKHNSFSEEKPLPVNLKLVHGYLQLSNPIVVRTNTTDQIKSTGLGLDNLSARLKLITGTSLLIEKDNGIFKVKLPLLKV